MPTTRVQLLRRYNLTPERYNEMLDRQGGQCGICQRPNNGLVKSFCIDHDHRCCPEQRRSCGSCVRGLLCGGCNGLLGYYELTVDQRMLRKQLERSNDYLRSSVPPGLPDQVPGQPGPRRSSTGRGDRMVLIHYNAEWIIENAARIRLSLQNRVQYLAGVTDGLRALGDLGRQERKARCEEAFRLNQSAQVLAGRAIHLDEFLSTGVMPRGTWLLAK